MRCPRQVIAAWLLLVIPLACSPSGLSPAPAAPAPARADNQADRLFLETVRTHILRRAPLAEAGSPLPQIFAQTSLPKRFDALALALYQPGQPRILVARRALPEIDLLRTVLGRVQEHPRLKDFDLADRTRVRIQLDFLVESPDLVRLADLSETARGPQRFEMGVDGLRLQAQGHTRYFLPGDAFVRSLLTVDQLHAHIRGMFPREPLDRIDARRLRGQSFVSCEDRWVRMYRGTPVIGAIGTADLRAAAERAVHLVTRTQQPDGRFLYYYDPEHDSRRDHQHPSRDPEKDPYYNILRHAGGMLLLLEARPSFPALDTASALRAAASYLAAQAKTYVLPDGETAACIFYNHKAKLGGSGLALHALAEYAHATGTRDYDDLMRRLTKHLLAQIRPSGEFYYYHIYPGRAKDDPGLFCFYYPGEALTGLASYYKHRAREDERAILAPAMHRALRFLLEERPRLYAEHFTSLPSDAWLMMAILSCWDVPDLRRDAYRDFVFAQADLLVDHMYTPENALYPDYVGAFYYAYGDPAYPDGARAEGLLAAQALACRTGDRPRAARYLAALQAAAWATLHLANTPESAYSVPRPDRTVGGIRFKYMRQWFRIDTIQHVAGFYLKLIPYWPGGSYYPYR